MVTDREADDIQTERERRRAAEAERIEKERSLHRQEVGRLAGESSGLPPPQPPPSGEPPRPPHPSGRSRRPTAFDDVARTAVSSRADPTKPIAPAGDASALGTFLAIGPHEGFDVRRLNLQRLDALVGEAGGDREQLVDLAARAEELMVRIKQELDDPLTAGAFLRERTREWYLESPIAPDWAGRSAAAWSGLFADSRTAGGQLVRWLTLRLNTVREEALKAGSTGSRLRRVVLRDRTADASLARTAQQQICGEIAQAMLDDLAARPRGADGPHPLVRLSELAVRRQIATVNDGLSLLFGSPETGPFVVLHPNRYPDCEEVEIRPPNATASGAALAFTLVVGRAGRRGATKGSAAEHPEGGAEIDPLEGNLWEAPAVSEANWLEAVDARRRERRRLESPPKEYRRSPAFAPLRALVLSNPEFRKSFLGVRWRGRPTGFPLVVALLQKGSLAPEVATDHEYLEAELTTLAEEVEGGSAADGRWQLGTWSIAREGSHADGFRYVALTREPPPG